MMRRRESGGMRDVRSYIKREQRVQRRREKKTSMLKTEEEGGKNSNVEREVR